MCSEIEPRLFENVDDVIVQITIHLLLVVTLRNLYVRFTGNLSFSKLTGPLSSSRNSLT